MSEILVTDRRCLDCGGPVTIFLIPDKVWDGLGYALADYACLACVSRRLNPQYPDPENVTAEIYRQRRRFKLKSVNRYDGLRIRRHKVVIADGEDGLTEMTAEQAAGGRGKRKKAA